MSSTEELRDVERMAEIMAELTKDARTLSSDLVKGIETYSDLGKALLAVGLVAAVSTAFLWNPGLYNGFVKYAMLALLYLLIGLTLVVAYRILRKYSALREKYGALIDISNKLGE